MGAIVGGFGVVSGRIPRKSATAIQLTHIRHNITTNEHAKVYFCHLFNLFQVFMAPSL